MLSRVGENLYWISRYVERAENLARLLDVSFHLELDSATASLTGAEPEPEPGPIESVLTILAAREAFVKTCDAQRMDREAILRFLTFDRANPHSILSMIGRARENARGSQESLSGESWSHINGLYLKLTSARYQRRFANSPPRFFESVKRGCVLFGGLIDNTLPRAEAYHFLRLGRYLERASQIARILSVKLPVFGEAPTELVHWSGLLQTCSATEAYLRENNEHVDPEGVVRYLVLDPDFPRAIRFCIARCCDSLRSIAGQSGDSELLSEAERRIGRLDSELRYLDVGEIFGQGLANFLYGVQQSCNAIGSEIHHAYFFT